MSDTASFSLAAFFVVPVWKWKTTIVRESHIDCRCAPTVISLVAMGTFTKTLVFSENNTDQTRAKYKSLRAKHSSSLDECGGWPGRSGFAEAPESFETPTKFVRMFAPHYPQSYLMDKRDDLRTNLHLHCGCSGSIEL